MQFWSIQCLQVLVMFSDLFRGTADPCLMAFRCSCALLVWGSSSGLLLLLNKGVVFYSLREFRREHLAQRICFLNFFSARSIDLYRAALLSLCSCSVVPFFYKKKTTRVIISLYFASSLWYSMIRNSCDHVIASMLRN